MVQNPPSSLNFLSSKGKWYVYVTIPSELRSAFNDQVQLRRSTGTSDKKVAKAREHGIAAEIYAQLDKARADVNLPQRQAQGGNPNSLSGQSAGYPDRRGLGISPVTEEACRYDQH
jgi:hypothetical protein